MKIIIPGLHNSDENHWQSHFERSNPAEFLRIHQENWDEPDCETWIAKIEQTLAEFDHSELILIGHSIGCVAIIHWFAKYQHAVKGALLVAPTDAEKSNFPNYISGFSPIPTINLPFPTIVVASTDDHVTSLERATEFALNWGSELIVLKNAGHIETKSGYGEWEEGRRLIHRLES